MRNAEADAFLAGGAYLDFGVAESDGEFKAKLNTAIQSIKADGSLNVLIAKWFDGKQGY